MEGEDSDVSCDVYLGTFSYGDIRSAKDTYDDKLEGLSEIYLQAISRGISIDLPPEEICGVIASQTPSKEWQLKNMMDMSSELITAEEKKQVSNYWSYSYANMNNSLRFYGGKKAHINDVIDRLQPLDKDIVVYRYLHDFEFLPKTPGDSFKSKGYFSSTMNPLLASSVVCDKKADEDGAILKIFVPAGKKAIFLPGREKELLFAHDIELMLLSHRKRKFICPAKDHKTCYIKDDMDVFEFQML